MMIDRRKVLLSLVVLVTLVASIAMLVENVRSGVAVHAQKVKAKIVTSTEYQVPTGADAWGTAFDSSGNVWVALPGCDFTPNCNNPNPGKIIRFSPSSNSWTATYQLPSGFGQPIFLAFDPQGNLWFTMPSTNSIGVLYTSSGTTQQFAVPTSAAGPWGIAVDSKGTVWFTEHFTNQIGSYNPTTQKFNEIATATNNSQPYGITVDTSDNVWFVENNPSVPAVAEYTAAGNLREFPMVPSGNNITPHLITVDTNGNVWWSEGWIGAIGELKVALANPGTGDGITHYNYHLSNTHTSGISVDGYGNIWFDDSVHSIYGSFPESGTGSFSIYNTVTSNAHPHDGLNVDKQNRIWFNEQFINRLALVTQPGVGTPTPTTSPTLTPTTPTSTPIPGKMLGKDTFQRANQAHWGKASDGQTWGGDANTLGVFSIKNKAGTVTNAGNNNYSAVLGPSTSNAEVLMSGSISSFANTSANFGALLRWQDGSNWYKAYLDGNTFNIQKKIAGNAITIVRKAFTAKANTSYTIRFRVVGTTFSAKVWATGSAEPSAWTLTTTDTTFASGYCGIRMLTQRGTATFTSFQAISA
ncbi:MAG: hypothetical protein NVSMB54_28920 [Ktedonobacteraceae bacterium]